MKIKEEDATQLLVDLIGIESPSRGEGPLAEFVAERLSAAGMKVYFDRHQNLYGEYTFGGEANRDGAYLKGEPAEAEGRRPCRQREEGPIVLFNTHLDNVPPGGGWKTRPFEAAVEDGVLWGRGACDPKGALTAMILAMECVIEEGKKEAKDFEGKKDFQGKKGFRGKLLFMGAVTEEISPPSEKGTWKAVKDGLIQADMAICGEPTENIPCIGEFGKVEYELIVHGKPAHASAPEKGVNAILNMAELLTALNQKVERRWSELLGRRGTFNVGTIAGGVQVNIIPELARASFERRLVPGQTAEESRRELLSICEEVKARIPELEYELVVTGEGNPAVISKDEPVAAMLSHSIQEVTGSRREAGGFVAHADADWLITYGGIPTVIYGPGALSDAHTSHEKVELSQVREAAEVLAAFLERAFLD